MPTEDGNVRNERSQGGRMTPLLVLLLCVTAILSALLARETNRRGRAELALKVYQDMAKQDQQVLSNVLSLRAQAATPAIQRTDLSPQTVQLNGASRPAFTISPDAGRRVGFLPGDVIVVAEPPATAPSH